MSAVMEARRKWVKASDRLRKLRDSHPTGSGDTRDARIERAEREAWQKYQEAYSKAHPPA